MLRNSKPSSFGLEAGQRLPCSACRVATAWSTVSYWNIAVYQQHINGTQTTTHDALPWKYTQCSFNFFSNKMTKLEMWANAQRDGRPAEHRWRPLFNAAKFGWRSLLYCCAVTLQRRECHWNLEGCPKLVNRSQPLVGRSSPYCGDMWRTHCCLTSSFPIVNTCLSCEDIARQICMMVPRWPFLVTFLRPVYSDLHLKFALRPHHVWKYGRHPICGGWD